MTFFELSNTEIEKRIKEEYKSEAYRNILRDRFILRMTYADIVQKNYPRQVENWSERRIPFLERKISKICNKFEAEVKK